MTFETFLSGSLITGAVIGFVAAMWGRIRALAWRACSLVVVRFTLEGHAANAVQQWLWKNAKRSRFGERNYGGLTTFVRPEDRQMAAGYEDLGRQTTVFWVGNRPILAGIPGVGINTFTEFKLTVTCLRGMFDSDTFVSEAIDAYNARRQGGEEKRFYVRRSTGSRRSDLISRAHIQDVRNEPQSADPAKCQSTNDDFLARRYLKWRPEELGAPIVVDPLGPLAFPPEVDELVRDARRWLASEKWYKARRIPWRLGFLFYGPPGTGKSTLARGIAMDLDLPVFAPELATYGDADFIEWWQGVLSKTPCMVLVEDIDTTFHGRENIAAKDGDGLKFGCLLNCVSGAEGADGVLFVVTTNHSDLIDPALGVPEVGSGRSTRPGRIDRAIELKVLSEDCRERIATRILSDCLHLVPDLVRKGDGMSGAQFQDLCAWEALAWHWRKPEVEVPKPAYPTLSAYLRNGLGLAGSLHEANDHR